MTTEEIILKIVEMSIWPVAIVIIVVGVVIILRKSISKVLEKARHISKDGIIIDPTPQQKIVDENIENKVYSYEEIMRELDSTSILNKEKSILKSLVQISFKDDKEKIKVLTRHLAATNVSFEFEGVIKTIWGSQIRLIKLLNTRKDKIALDDCKQFYENGKNEYPETYKNYSFDKYMEYLKDSTLIEIDNTSCLITDFGEDFLVYLVKTGQDINYPF